MISDSDNQANKKFGRASSGQINALSKYRIEQNEIKERKFYQKFVKFLEPRYYDQSSGDMIQEQYEEIFEVIFITNGAVGVGYRLFNEVFYGTSIIMSQNKRIIAPINDYSTLSDKCSEFLYKPIEHVEGLAIRKVNFYTVMKDTIAQKMRPAIAATYRDLIQQPLHEHRTEMACKFENRIDYIDISAYGIGKVKLDAGGNIVKQHNTDERKKEKAQNMESE